LWLTGCASVPPQPRISTPGDFAPLREHIAGMIRQEMAANDVVGAAVVLVDDQEVVWAEGFGYANPESGVPVEVDTPFRLGSIAKVMTASLAMRMAERGEIDLDAPLADILPAFSVRTRFPGTGPITPRNILSHHSGLPANRFAGMLGTSPAPIASLVPAMREEYVAYPPDYVFSYSNLAVTLLGAALESRCGQSFDTLMRRELFLPLGMRDTRIDGRPAFGEFRDGQPVQAMRLRDLPSGGLVSTARDMGRYLRMLFGGGQLEGRRVLRQDSLDEMWRVQNPGNALDFDLRVGLGWMLSGMDIATRGPVASHGGTLLDSHSMMIVLPEHKLGVVVMTNSSGGVRMVADVASAALNLALRVKGVPAPAMRADLTAGQAPPRLAGATFDTLVGLARVHGEGDILEADVLGHTLELRPTEAGHYRLRYKLFGLIPISLGVLDNIRLDTHRQGERELLIGHFGDYTRLLGQRLRPAPIPADLLDAVGDYEVAGDPGGLAPDSLALRLEDGWLVGEVRFSRFPGLVLRNALEVVSEHELVVAGLGTGKGETIRLVGEGASRHLLFSGYALRRKQGEGVTPASAHSGSEGLDRLVLGQDGQGAALGMPAGTGEAARLQGAYDLGG
jgi:CubicO group peptidase (beta-lactamase class C family)